MRVSKPPKMPNTKDAWARLLVAALFREASVDERNSLARGMGAAPEVNEGEALQCLEAIRQLGDEAEHFVDVKQQVEDIEQRQQIELEKALQVGRTERAAKRRRLDAAAGVASPPAGGGAAAPEAHGQPQDGPEEDGEPEDVRLNRAKTREELRRFIPGEGNLLGCQLQRWLKPPPRGNGTWAITRAS